MVRVAGDGGIWGCCPRLGELNGREGMHLAFVGRDGRMWGLEGQKAAAAAVLIGS